MNLDLILDYFEEYNEHELFYRKYYEKKKDEKAFQDFLQSLDPQYVRQNHLIVPELTASTAQTDLPMQEDWYFGLNTDKCVYLTRHNRYTPPFTHTHTFFEIIYVLKGNCLHNIHGNSYTMQEGDLCMISPAVEHSIFADGSSIVINILIRRSNIEDIFLNALRDQNIISDFLVNSIYLKDYAAYIIFHTLDDVDVKEQILEMYLEQFENEAFSDRIISSMLMIFFIKLVRKYKRTAEIHSALPAGAAAAQLLHYIVNNSGTITLNELAAKLNYSVPYCSKYIKKMTGQSFIQLQKRVRFQKAENYLAATNFSIQKISYLLGYENPENFIRAFKKEYGISPSKYRTPDV